MLRDLGHKSSDVLRTMPEVNKPFIGRAVDHATHEVNRGVAYGVFATLICHPKMEDFFEQARIFMRLSFWWIRADCLVTVLILACGCDTVIPGLTLLWRAASIGPVGLG